MRKKIVAGNWKMNLNWQEASSLFNSIKNIDNKDVEIIIFPSTPYLLPFLQDKDNRIKIGSQNGYHIDNGAYTGETSIAQLKNIGVTHVLVGHSERREYFSENNEMLKSKVDACLRLGITPVFCCGEPLEIREKKIEKKFVETQIKESLFHLSAEEIQKCIIAYEPIWAIGTGKTASVEQAEKMHLFIRNLLAENYSEVASKISILYGGSCNENNAKELFSCPNVDGGLVGGASLKEISFKQIINSF